jgi:hypothetical protein
MRGENNQGVNHTSNYIENGEMIEDMTNSNVYEIFAKYFQYPIMTKVKTDGTGKFSVYACKSPAMLGIEYRYILAIIKEDNADKGTKRRLDELHWVSLQTRTLKDEYKVDTHSYLPRRMKELDKRIVLINKDEKQYEYVQKKENMFETVMPIKITLLANSKSGVDYSSTGNILNALETYNTIITL